MGTGLRDIPLYIRGEGQWSGGVWGRWEGLSAGVEWDGQGGTPDVSWECADIWEGGRRKATE